ARRAALCHHQRRQAPAAGQQDRLAQGQQGSRHHHPRRHRPQRVPYEQRPGRRGDDDGSDQRRDGDRRRQDPRGRESCSTSTWTCCAPSWPRRAISSTARPAFRRTRSPPSSGGRATMRGKAKVEAPRRVASGIAAGGCADASIYRRFHRAGLTQLTMFPYLVPVTKEDPRFALFQQQHLAALEPGEADEWRKAVEELRLTARFLWLSPSIASWG